MRIRFPSLAQPLLYSMNIFVRKDGLALIRLEQQARRIQMDKPILSPAGSPRVQCRGRAAMDGKLYFFSRGFDGSADRRRSSAWRLRATANQALRLAVCAPAGQTGAAAAGALALQPSCRRTGEGRRLPASELEMRAHCRVC